MVKAIKMVKDQRGLTLIELLAVIVILAIILAIAVPAIGNLINRTDDRATVSDAAQVIAAAKLHVATNGVPALTNNVGFLSDDDLQAYLDNAEWSTASGAPDPGVRVTVNNNVVTYQVVGHAVSGILPANTAATEEAIQNYLDTNR